MEIGVRLLVPEARASSSTGERSFHTREAAGSNPALPMFHRRRIAQAAERLSRGGAMEGDSPPRALRLPRSPDPTPETPAATPLGDGAMKTVAQSRVDSLPRFGWILKPGRSQVPRPSSLPVTSFPGSVAQAAELPVLTRAVAGSTPAGVTARKDCHWRGIPFRKRLGLTALGVRLPLLPLLSGVVELARRAVVTREIAGSIPAAGARTHHMPPWSKWR